MWFTVFSLGFYISSTINLWVGLFLPFALVMAHIPHPTPYSGEALLMVILGSVLYLIFYNIYDRRVVFTILCLFALANVFAVILQLTKLDFQLTINKALFLSDKSIRIGMLDCRNSLSAALAICLPAFFGSRWKWFIPIVLLGIVLAKSVGGMLAATPALFYYSQKYFFDKFKHYHVPKYLIFAYAGLIVLIGGVLFVKYIDVPNYKSRWAAWKMYGELNTEYKLDIANPLVGQGLGHWKAIFKRKDIREKIGYDAGVSKPLYYAQAHNEYMQVDFEMGLFGIALIIGFMVGVLRRVKNTDPRPILALLAIVIDAMVFFPFHIPLLSIIMIMWLASLARESRCTV